MDIPKSIRMTESSRPEAQSWTFLVEILLDNLLGVGQQMRTLCQMMVWTHTLYLGMLYQFPRILLQ
jgi:hypothetical protein